VNSPTINQQSPAPRRFDAPVLSDSDTLRVVARHDATSERRRFDSGFQDGREAGLASGRAEVDAAIHDHRHNAERLDALSRALEHALAQTQQREAEAIALVEDAVVELSVQIAESLVHREITDHGAVVDVIRHSLELCAGDDAVARVHPDDLACAVEARTSGLIEASSEVRLIADASVARGGCSVDAGAARLDAQIAPAIERIRNALTHS